MDRCLASALFALVAATHLAGQPNVPINNEHVRVVMARNVPGQRSRLHKHDVNRVMVHLDDGRMRLAFEDGPVNDVPFKSGDVRWDPAGGMHTSENTGGTNYRIVEVELKKSGGVAAHLHDLHLTKTDAAHSKIEFENEQVRVVRTRAAAGAAIPKHSWLLPCVVVYLTDSHERVEPEGGSATEHQAKAGEAAWLSRPHPVVKSQNLRKASSEQIVIEIKTR